MAQNFSDLAYQAITGTTEPWGGCDQLAAVGRVVDLIDTARRDAAACRCGRARHDESGDSENRVLQRHDGRLPQGRFDQAKVH